ncbi:bifunctional lytic transglycosylase/C40 family peptidase [Kibdelosporangium philippinense]|uniref:Bifunctional lytic transglycosylase/C40 family peptidase n=1 Tax=Kibdelosporangium philippinense TaxID=211113 RepID=A0ABS8ZVC9_9PSEU|nr:bifunctional lytic transglycosylase/C40 family peptidase [Kibdelosporangium philippinense]MCE7011690.1 bifunctional lytic transglycosylase/C40 family peptidase [Kibdelosporangium philippinense]
MKIASAALAAIIAFPILIGGIGQAIVTAIFGSGSTQPSQQALADIPADYLDLYQTAAPACPGLDWSILAAIGKIESDHGRSTLPGVRSGHNGVHGPTEGAMGPMQFMPTTWRDVRARHPEIGADVYRPENAIPGAAHYLCDSGAQKDIRKAIFAYNHADWYVNDVLAQAKKYGDAMVGTGTCTTIQAPNPAAAMAINYACGQLGLPYVWGGNGPDGGHAGFDCSGLTKAAYGAAGITLPRTAQTQYNAGPLVPAGEPLLPGDLIFYGTPNNVHHVGLYIGAGKMVHASTFGQPVKISPYRWNGDDYLAASRPVNRDLLH